uniref:Uncharacterized protein n=1 Tax=Romanomermis culicivorax TaxID=13658 RepID=A0A915I6R2_ROMCU
MKKWTLTDYVKKEENSDQTSTPMMRLSKLISITLGALFSPQACSMYVKVGMVDYEAKFVERSSNGPNNKISIM